MGYPVGPLARECARRGTNLAALARSVGKSRQHFNAARGGGWPLARRWIRAVALHWGCDPRTAEATLLKCGVKLGKVGTSRRLVR